MQRSVSRLLGCLLVGILAVGVLQIPVSEAQAPTPVIRMGDWVEIGNEVFMNLIAQADIRYVLTHNYDFEDDLRDRVATRQPNASSVWEGEFDGTQVEVRFGGDFRYQKNLRLRVLAESQHVMDGNLIDDRHNTSSPGPARSSTGLNASTENNGFHIERYWIDYAFPRTPLRMRVGADLWTLDQAGVLGDDDPRFALFLDLGPKKEIELAAAYVLQEEAARLGLQNDNDFSYYTFHFGYNGLNPHKLALDLAYFRDRFNGADGQTRAGQEVDSVLIMPSWTGTIGPVRALLEGMLVWGQAEPTNVSINRDDLDIFSWGIVAQAEVDLGVVRPFLGVVVGSADDDPTDNDLEGFAPFPERSITLMSGTPYFSMLTDSPSLGRRNASPAQAPGFDSEFRHTTSNPFSDRLGRLEHRDAAGNVRIDTPYSNPGTLVIPAGVKILPLKGHEIVLFYLYVGMLDSTLAETIAERNRLAGNTRRISISETLYHEIGATWTWTLNSHFDIKLNGYIDIPADGVKDIAATQNCNEGGAFRACKGEDPALRGELRIRGRF